GGGLRGRPPPVATPEEFGLMAAQSVARGTQSVETRRDHGRGSHGLFSTAKAKPRGHRMTISGALPPEYQNVSLQTGPHLFKFRRPGRTDGSYRRNACAPAGWKSRGSPKPGDRVRV